MNFRRPDEPPTQSGAEDARTPDASRGIWTLETRASVWSACVFSAAFGVKSFPFQVDVLHLILSLWFRPNSTTRGRRSSTRRTVCCRGSDLFALAKEQRLRRATSRTPRLPCSTNRAGVDARPAPACGRGRGEQLVPCVRHQTSPPLSKGARPEPARIPQ